MDDDSKVPLTSIDLDKIMEAMSVLSDAMEKLGDAVESTNDADYTIRRGGRAFSIDTEELEQQAEDDEEFLRNAKN